MLEPNNYPARNIFICSGNEFCFSYAFALFLDYGTLLWEIIFVGSLFYCDSVGRVRTGKENYDLFPCILL